MCQEHPFQSIKNWNKMERNMKKGLTKRYRKFGWDFFELLDLRRQTKVREKHKKSFSKRARAFEKEQFRNEVLKNIE